MHIFISYSKLNIRFARHLRHLLVDEGYKVWMDEQQLVPSQRWWPTILQNIDTCSAFLIIMSPEAETSDWVEREILRAERKEKRENKRLIFPILLSGEVWARLAERQYEDMTAGESADLSEYLKRGLDNLAPRFADEPPPPPLPGPPLPMDLQPSERPLNLRILTPVALVIVVLLLTVYLILNRQPVTVTNIPTFTQKVARVPTDFRTDTPKLTSPVTDVLPQHTLTPTTPTITVTSTAVLPTSTLITSPFGATAVTNNADWKPITQMIDGVQMVLVPVGCFIMGSNDGETDEAPVSKQCIKVPFWIDKTEVTNNQYGSAGKFKGGSYPREMVTWFQARDFCAKRGARLPTEREWEYAARGPSDFVYPWGNYFIADNVVYLANSNSQTANVGSHYVGDSWVGASDLSGNVWEWVSSIYQPYPYKAFDGREMDSTSITVLRVLRGGSWYVIDSHVRSTYRSGSVPTLQDDRTGFRCARSQ